MTGWREKAPKEGNCMTIRTMVLREFTESKITEGNPSREARAA